MHLPFDFLTDCSCHLKTDILLNIRLCKYSSTVYFSRIEHEKWILETFGFQSTSPSMGWALQRMISTACSGKSWNWGGSWRSWCDFTSCVRPSSMKQAVTLLNNRSPLSGISVTRTLWWSYKHTLYIPVINTRGCRCLFAGTTGSQPEPKNKKNVIYFI